MGGCALVLQARVPAAPPFLHAPPCMRASCKASQSALRNTLTIALMLSSLHSPIPAPARPAELDVGHPVIFGRCEVFDSDDYACHPLSAGKHTFCTRGARLAHKLAPHIRTAADCVTMPYRRPILGHQRLDSQGGEAPCVQCVPTPRFARLPCACAVCGKCEVLTPAQAGHRPGGSATERARPNTFECSRKYIASKCFPQVWPGRAVWCCIDTSRSQRLPRPWLAKLRVAVFCLLS